jgi:cell division initiation protein
MKLTPLDIHHKEFHRALRGYNEEEVDKFLDEVAEEFERLFKENIDLKEQLEKIKDKLEHYQNLESTIQSTLLTAQKSAEEVRVQAKKEAELVLKDAELKAKEIIQSAEREKEELQQTYVDLQKAEEEFRTKFRAILESYLQLVEERKVPAAKVEVPPEAEEAKEVGEVPKTEEAEAVTEAGGLVDTQEVEEVPGEGEERKGEEEKRAENEDSSGYNEPDTGGIS